MERERKLKKQMEKKVDRTPYFPSFSVEGNMITLQKEKGEYQLVMLNTVVDEMIFCISVRIIHTSNRKICIGLTDRLTQRNRQSVNHSHSIYYYGGGAIYYGTEEKAQPYRESITNDCLSSGMEVVIKVDMQASTVTFNLHEESINRNTFKPIKGTRQYQVVTPLLTAPSRHLVPFFQMINTGDSIAWNIL